MSGNLSLTSAESCWACSAASIISVSRRTSRCIDRPSLGQHRRSQHRMQGAQGHQIYPMAEQSGEFVSEFLDLPAQSPSRAQCVQNIDVAVRPSGAARLRAEDLE